MRATARSPSPRPAWAWRLPRKQGQQPPEAGRPPCPGTGEWQRRAAHSPAEAAPRSLQDFERDGGRRHRQCKSRDHGAAPADQPDGIGEHADRERSERQLCGAEAEYGAPHRHQPAKLELEPDQEQQHDHAQLGNRDDALRRGKHRQPIGTDDDAGDQIGDNGRQPEPPRDRNAQDGGSKKDESRMSRKPSSPCCMVDSAMQPGHMPGHAPDAGTAGRAHGTRLRRARFSNMDRTAGRREREAGHEAGVGSG